MKIIDARILSAFSLVAWGACGGDKPAPAPPLTAPAPTAPAPTANPGDPAPTTLADKAALADNKPAEAPDGEVSIADERATGPVAKVNGVEIPPDEFNEELDKIISRNAKIPRDRLGTIKQNILKRLIEQELINQAVKAANVTLADAEIEAAMTEYKARFQTDEQFQRYLSHGKVTLESIKQRLIDKGALEKLIEKQGQLAVTDEEIKDFYDKNLRFYQEKPGTKARHILVKLDEKATPEQEKAALEKVKGIQAELKKGKNFEELADQHSEGPSKGKGGDLGFFGAGQMVPAFEEAAAKLKIGEISEPVRSKFGYHLIKVEERREERTKPLEEVKDQIAKSIRNKKFFQERRKLLQELQQKAQVETLIKGLPKPRPEAAGVGGDHDEMVHEPAIRVEPHGLPVAPTVVPRPSPMPGRPPMTPPPRTPPPATPPAAKPE
jgi:peptidyl-prolyl cis-trans isomerase C